MTYQNARPMAFLAISGLCLALHNAIMIGGDAAGLSIGFSLILSFGAVLSFGYLAHSHFTFDEPLSAARFARYGLAMLVNLPIAAITIWLFARSLRMPMWMASPLSTMCGIAFNFVLSHWAISHPRQVNKP